MYFIFIKCGCLRVYPPKQLEERKSSLVSSNYSSTQLRMIRPLLCIFPLRKQRYKPGSPLGPNHQDYYHIFYKGIGIFRNHSFATIASWVTGQIQDIYLLSQWCGVVRSFSWGSLHPKTHGWQGTAAMAATSRSERTEVMGKGGWVLARSGQSDFDASKWALLHQL